MRLKFLIACLVAAGIAVAGWRSASLDAQEPPAPSAGTVLTSGLLQPRGMSWGPDGMLYVAEAGTGGDTQFQDGELTLNNGFTGRVSKIDPATGTRTTVVDGLPSQAFPETGEAVGPADVGFIGSQLYLLMTHSNPDYGFDGWATGIYRVTAGGDTVLVADIGAFNKANPVEAITSGVQVDVEHGGNPYSMITREGTFYVSDGNHNRLMRVTTGGDVSEIVEFPNHPVSTGIADTDSGAFYVAYLGQGPFLPENGKVVSVGANTGTITEIASGQSMLTDVQVGPGGQLYALQFNNPEEAGEAFFAPGTGKVLRVNGDGTMSPLITGLSFATDMSFRGDALYISNFGIAPDGQIVRVNNFSSVQPPAAATPTTPAQPAPTATPTRPSGVVAPDTGSGGYLGEDGGASVMILIVVTIVAGAGAVGTAAVVRRR